MPPKSKIHELPVNMFSFTDTCNDLRVRLKHQKHQIKSSPPGFRLHCHVIIHTSSICVPRHGFSIFINSHLMCNSRPSLCFGPHRPTVHHQSGDIIHPGFSHQLQHHTFLWAFHLCLFRLVKLLDAKEFGASCTMQQLPICECLVQPMSAAPILILQALQFSRYRAA